MWRRIEAAGLPEEALAQAKLIADAISAQRATQARLAAAHTGLAAAGEARWPKNRRSPRSGAGTSARRC